MSAQSDVRLDLQELKKLGCNIPDETFIWVADPNAFGRSRIMATLIITTQGKTVFDYHASQRYEISSDLPQDELGEAVTLEIQKAWKRGLDPVVDGLTVFLQFA
jgi:hypothetical protein